MACFVFTVDKKQDVRAVYVVVIEKSVDKVIVELLTIKNIYNKIKSS